MTPAEARALLGVLGDVDGAHFENYTPSAYKRAVKALNELKRMAGWGKSQCQETEWTL